MTSSVRHFKRLPRCIVLVAALVFFVAIRVPGQDSEHAYGIDSRPKTKPFLAMPANANGVLPERLSQTGAFKDLRQLTPGEELIPYDLVVPFWSDHAAKSRWVSVPDGQAVKFDPTGEWIFPRGTVFVKSFALATNDADPNSLRRLETRLLVCNAEGGVYGVAYRWRSDDSDADLLATN